ncbi:MAG: glycosyltransferase family A protein [Acetobacteraceae bacterium]
MRIGVIIPAYNVAPWIAQAIWSVIDQTYRDWSLVIVNDGSTDATPEIIRRFSDSRLTGLHGANYGVSAARNRGIAAAADADALLFLDGDDWLAPDALATLARTLQDAPDAVAAAAGYVRVGADRSHRTVRISASGDMLRQLLVRNLFINGGHLLIRRTAINAVGLFDTALSYGEDWHYWTRLATFGPFVTVRGSPPLLYLRERTGSAYRTMAHSPARFGPCLDAIYHHPCITARFPPSDLAQLRRRAEAENDWVVGRELIRHGHSHEGRSWLLRSVKAVPSARRIGLLCASWSGFGPFRPYAASASTNRRGTACTGMAA